MEESVVETLTKYVPRAMLDKFRSKIGHSSDVLKTNKDAKAKSHHDDTIPRQELVATTFAGERRLSEAVCQSVMHAQHVYVHHTTLVLIFHSPIHPQSFHHHCIEQQAR